MILPLPLGDGACDDDRHDGDEPKDQHHAPARRTAPEPSASPCRPDAQHALTTHSPHATGREFSLSLSLTTHHSPLTPRQRRRRRPRPPRLPCTLLRRLHRPPLPTVRRHGAPPAFSCVYYHGRQGISRLGTSQLSRLEVRLLFSPTSQMHPQMHPHIAKPCCFAAKYLYLRLYLPTAPSCLDSPSPSLFLCTQNPVSPAPWARTLSHLGLLHGCPPSADSCCDADNRRISTATWTCTQGQPQ